MRHGLQGSRPNAPRWPQFDLFGNGKKKVKETVVEKRTYCRKCQQMAVWVYETLGGEQTRVCMACGEKETDANRKAGRRKQRPKQLSLELPV